MSLGQSTEASVLDIATSRPTWTVAGDLEALTPRLPRPAWALRGVRSADLRMSKPVEDFYETLLEPNRGHIWRQDANRLRKMPSRMSVCSFYACGIGRGRKEGVTWGSGEQAGCHWVTEWWSWLISELC